jgi:hypothetical protein
VERIRTEGREPGKCAESTASVEPAADEYHLRVRSHCRFSIRGAEYVSEYCMERMGGGVAMRRPSDDATESYDRLDRDLAYYNRSHDAYRGA